MMVLILCIVIATGVTLLFSTLTYALRSYSRSRLEDELARRGRPQWFDRIVRHEADLIFVTATLRLLANILLTLAAMELGHQWALPTLPRLAIALLLAGSIGLFFSVAVPGALAEHMGESILAACARLLLGARVALSPISGLMRWSDRLVRRLTGGAGEPEPEQIEKDILSVVEEGEKEGVVDTQEREMIESVIEFRDTQAGQIMTTRPEIVALEIGAALEQVKRTVEESGHSRLPVYDGTLDHIVGVLYARDLLKHLGQPPQQFDIRSAMRPAIFVPETKPLRDLLRDFRAQKVHIAIVLDEYGGTAGLVTIEDILEELVGEISDEHEPAEPPMLRRIDDNNFEVDARLAIEEANRLCGLSLPEEEGYDTIGGFLVTTVGTIPQQGTAVEHAGARFTVLEAEPQRVKRLRVELMPQPVPPDDGGR